MSTRRYFLSRASAATLAAWRPRPLSGANDRIRLAVLGVNGRGRDHIAGFEGVPGVEVACLCDPDQRIARARAGSFEGRYGRKVAIESDLRRVFDRKDIDAVSIATPNHWHALATIWACQAGKDVYVEKPGSHNLFEGRRMVEAAAKYKRIVQHGVQLRSSEALREAVEKLRAGVIGKVYLARGIVYRWRPSIGNVAPSPVPPEFDYDLWQGPAPEHPFSKRWVPYNWHWHWDYGNGDLGNQGIHETDMCLWGLGEGLPGRVAAMGGKFLFDDDKETPELLTCTFGYPESKKMIQLEVRAWCTNEEGGTSVGNIFYGSEGYMVIDGYDKYTVYLGKHRSRGPSRHAGGNHWANFIGAVRSRKVEDLHAPVETAHTASGLAHLGNIAFRVGRLLQFDPAAERFIGDPEADALLTRPYRDPYRVPERV